MIGVAYEDFKACVLDLSAMIAFARRLGYRHIFLAGHSTGANKIVYYQYRTHDRRVKGLLLAGGLSDIAADRKHVRSLKAALRRAKQLVGSKRLQDFVWHRGKFYTARRFVSLYSPGKAEDVFPVYNPRARWTAMRSIRVPLAVVFGQRDEHLDRRARELVDLYRQKAVRTLRYDRAVIKAADHGFRGHERELAAFVVKWIRIVSRDNNG